MSRCVSRLCRAIVLTTVSLATVSLTATSVQAQTTGATSVTPSKKITLQQRLEKGLKARRKSELKYIAEVVDLVEKGKLPEKVVDGAFFQSRRKRRPMQHFQFSLEARGKKLRLPTPKFDPLQP
jgi:hypothetical protein